MGSLGVPKVRSPPRTAVPGVALYRPGMTIATLVPLLTLQGPRPPPLTRYQRQMSGPSGLVSARKLISFCSHNGMGAPSTGSATASGTSKVWPARS
jgi:hypothetical protein